MPYYPVYTTEWFAENGKQALRHIERAMASLRKNEAYTDRSNYGAPWHPTYRKLLEAQEMLQAAVKSELTA